VTGGASGIGAAISMRLAGEGAIPVVFARHAPDDAFWRELARKQPRAACVSVELQDDAQCRDAVAQTVAQFGHIDGLVNNAAVEHYGDCWAQPDAELDEMLAVNVTAPFVLSQAFARHWVGEGRQGAVIVNVCSIESQVGWPTPGQAAYAATKGGLLGLTRALALDLADRRIRVVAVGPGPIDTEMAPADRAYARRIPLGGEPGTPEDVGAATVFLLSDAARFITDEILYVDGGYLVP